MNPQENLSLAEEWVQATANADPPIIAPLLKARTRSLPPAPTMKDVRYVKREVTRLVNDMPRIHTELVETRTLLEHATSILRNVSEDFKEMSKVQQVLEWDHVEKYKDDRRLWDGTHLMPDEDFASWDLFLEQLRVEEEKARLEEERREDECQELKNREMEDSNEAE